MSRARRRRAVDVTETSNILVDVLEARPIPERARVGVYVHAFIHVQIWTWYRRKHLLHFESSMLVVQAKTALTIIRYATGACRHERWLTWNIPETCRRRFPCACDSRSATTQRQTVAHLHTSTRGECIGILKCSVVPEQVRYAWLHKLLILLRSLSLLAQCG